MTSQKSQYALYLRGYAHASDRERARHRLHVRRRREAGCRRGGQGADVQERPTEWSSARSSEVIRDGNSYFRTYCRDVLDTRVVSHQLDAGHLRLHAFSLLMGIVGAATVVGAFLTGWPSIIAVILNYVKRSEVRGTWLESHFRWQIRTFWFGLLWVVLCVLFVIFDARHRPARRVAAARHRQPVVHLPDRARLDGAERPSTDVYVASGFSLTATDNTLKLFTSIRRDDSTTISASRAGWLFAIATRENSPGQPGV